MSRLSPVVVALSLLGAVAATPTEAALRAFVSSTGMDSNTATGCGVGAPCRSFASAQTVVSDGGEIIALDAAGYGPITITKNVTITANPGFYAGIAVPTGDGITIATAGINVTLRGLNINGTGGGNGVYMTDGSKLSIENCVISNFGSVGVYVNTAATVRIVDSLIRENGFAGVYLYGPTATISGVKVLGNFYGVYVTGGGGSTTTAAVSDSVAAGGLAGFNVVNASAGATARLSLTRSTASNNGTGIIVDTFGGGGTQIVTVSDSMVTGNSTGIFVQGVGSTLESLGNNTVRQNGTNTVGTITVVSGT